MFSALSEALTGLPQNTTFTCGSEWTYWADKVDLVGRLAGDVRECYYERTRGGIRGSRPSKNYTTTTGWGKGGTET